MNLPASFYKSGLHDSGVYLITCAASGKVYIGSAVDMFLRWRSHYHRLNRGDHHNEHLQRAWLKYGPDNFSFSVAESCPRELLRVKEQEYLDATPAELRYNLSPTAGSVLGFKMPQEVLDRMRPVRSAFRHSEETKQRMKEIPKPGRPPGFHLSDKQKAQLSAARKGKPLSPDHARRSAENLRKIAERRKGQPWTDEHRENLSRSKRALSDEQIAEAKRRYLAGESMPQIALRIGVSSDVIERAVRGRYVSDNSGGVTVKVKRESPSKGKPGRVWTPEQREKARLSHLGRTISPAQREKLSAAKSEYWASKTPEYRARISAELRAASAARMNKASQPASAHHS